MLLQSSIGPLFYLLHFLSLSKVLCGIPGGGALNWIPRDAVPLGFITNTFKFFGAVINDKFILRSNKTSSHIQKVDSSYLKGIQSDLFDLRVANSILNDRVENLRVTVNFYKSELKSAREETKSIKRLLLSQIEDLKLQHVKEKNEIIAKLNKENALSIRQIKKELYEKFENEKLELTESLNNVHLEEICSLRLELEAQVDNAQQEVSSLKRTLSSEKRKMAERLKEVEVVRNNQETMATVSHDKCCRIKNCI